MWKDWLGKLPDTTIAVQFGLHHNTVYGERRKTGIPKCPRFGKGARIYVYRARTRLSWALLGEGFNEPALNRAFYLANNWAKHNNLPWPPESASTEQVDALTTALMLAD